MIEVIFYFKQGVAPAFGTQLAFPHCHHAPAETAQAFFVLLIAFAVAGYLLFPVFAVGLWQPQVGLMSVPETSVYENGDTILFKHYVRGARECAHILPVAVSSRIEVLPHDKLGLGVLALDASHAS